LNKKKHIELALQYYKKAFDINSHGDYVLGKYTVTKQRAADWQEIKQLTKKLEKHDRK
jgi:hypothetical protein